MFYLYLLIALGLIVGVLFAVPVKRKVWVALAAVSVAAVGLIIPAIGVLVGSQQTTLLHLPETLFGAEVLSIDPLSALFLLIIGLAGVATVIYSRGYLAHYLTKKSSAHISLHYSSVVIHIEWRILVPLCLGVDDDRLVSLDSL